MFRQIKVEVTDRVMMHAINSHPLAWAIMEQHHWVTKVVIQRDTVILFDLKDQPHVFLLTREAAEWCETVEDPARDEWGGIQTVLTHKHPSAKIATRPEKQLSFLLDR